MPKISARTIADPIGHETLEIMAQAQHYNKWVYSIIKPFLRGDVAEVGAGTGTFSDLISKDGYQITAIDYSSDYLKIISQKNKKINTLLFDMQSNSLPTNLSQKFDTVVILNVLEHLADHTKAMQHLHKMLKRDGNLIVLVPGFQIAYGSMDEHLGHFRRYTKKSFERLANLSGFDIVSTRYINILGLVGWFINARWFGSETISNFQVKMFDIISRPVLFFEKFISLPVGLSLVCVVKKP